VWLLFLGPFFFASYGFANWMASRRAHVGAVAFGWEHAIPFVPWTIVPYWSIDLLYTISFFLCVTRRELDRHAQRLFAAQVVSVAFFLALPLRFSFERPVADGVFGALFAALGSFDKPFNQAPSLHISLLVILWVRFAAHMERRWLWLLHGWMTLIGVSILTTYQHHFIDLPTGLAAGFLVLWALPETMPSPLSQLAWTSDSKRRRLALHYALGSLALTALSARGGGWLWCAWPAGSLMLVSVNYALIGPRGFQKLEDGRQTVGAFALYLPYTIAAWINSRAWTFQFPEPVRVADGVWLGRIPSREERRAIVDVCAEIPSLATGASCTVVPVLDLTVPDRDSLRRAAEAIEAARAGGDVLVCCALGYSRSAAAVAAWLLMTRRAESVDAATAIVRKARPRVVLSPEHLAMLGA
jgi:hypothetical protein